MARTSTEQRVTINLPEIEDRQASLVHSGSKKRPTSGSAFPRTRRFSYESAESLKQREKGFVLDCVALSRQTNEDIGRSQPSVDIGIPQYNALGDKHAQRYFKRKGLPKTVTAPEPSDKSSMKGSLFDNYMKKIEPTQYLEERQERGSGNYIRSSYGGHTTVPTDPTFDGYHGKEGYRRNTFDLRRRRSVFDEDDPFENPRPLLPPRHRTMSAPATIQYMRQKSATVYRSYPGVGRPPSSGRGIKMGGRRVQSAIPMTTPTELRPIRELAKEPCIQE